MASREIIGHGRGRQAGRKEVIKEAGGWHMQEKCIVRLNKLFRSIVWIPHGKENDSLTTDTNKTRHSRS